MARPKGYTDSELAYIKRYYPTCDTSLIALELGWPVKKVIQLANSCWIHKKVRNAKKAPRKRKPLNYKACDDYSFKPTGKPIVIPTPQPSDYIHSGRPEHYKPQIYPLYDHYQAVAAKHDALAPRKNWLQRLVSWLLTGRV